MGRGVIHWSIPALMKSGLDSRETRIPVMRHNIQTGNCAPAMLMTGAYPAEMIEPAPTSGLIGGMKLNVTSRWILTLRRLHEAKRRTKS